MITVTDPKTGTSTLSYHLTNVGSEDALFLGEVMALFTDPQHAQHLADWRAGTLAVTRDEFGKLKLVRLVSFQIPQTKFTNN